MPMKSYSERRAILIAIQTVGKFADFQDIEAGLPSPRTFAIKRTALRQMLKLMEREGLVTRVPTGAYFGIAGSGWGGLGSDDQIVHCISGCLRECDGVMRLDDVVRDFVDCRIWGPDEREVQSRRIQKIIMSTTCFRLEASRIILISERPSGLVAPPAPHSPTASGQVPTAVEPPHRLA